MRARRRTILAVLGFLLLLLGGLASIVGAIGLVDIVRNGDQTLTGVGWGFLVGGPAMVVTGVAILRKLHQRWRTTESYGTGTVVLAWSRRSLIWLNLFLTLVALVTLAFGLGNLIDGFQNLIEGHGFTGHGGGLWTGFLGIVGLLFALGAGIAWVENVQRLDHQDPLFMVDDGGIECAQGRYSWRDVERVLQVTEITGSGEDRTVKRSLAFALRDGTAARPVERPYLEEDAAVTPFGFVLGITHCTSQSVAALTAYGHAPVKGELSELLPKEPEPAAPEPAVPLLVEPATPEIASEPPSGDAPFWPPPPGWSGASGPELVLDQPIAVKHPVRDGVLLVLGLVLVLVGGLLVIGSIGSQTSSSGKSSVAGFVAGLVFSLALVAGGAALIRRLRRKRKASEPARP